MVFSTLTFLFAFLPIVLALYYIVPKKAKNMVLLIASLVFYAWGEPIYVLLMIYGILFNYAFGLLMEKHPEHKKYILIFSVIMDLGILFFFKYYGFFIDNINRIPYVNLPKHNLELPIGISFYTFQTLSYMIDLYRGKFPAQKKLVDFALYISMFPQLIAGPIVRYESIYPELQNRRCSLKRFGKGSLRFAIGLGKKVLLANMVGAIFDSVNAMTGISAGSAWIGAIAYTFQIYFDFSGYSDMAIGLGRMFGFRFDENFDHPYMAKTVTDFWRRWHISLSSWFKEYVYIPLGGNRCSTAKHIRNIMIVWLLTGLWHGAKWTFVVWGLYYGVLLLIDKYVVNRNRQVTAWVTQPLTIILFIIGWTIFAADSMGAAITRIGEMFGAGAGLWDAQASYLLRTNGIILLLCLLFSTSLPAYIRKKLFESEAGKLILLIILIAILALCTVCLVTQNYNPFLYFQF